MESAGKSLMLLGAVVFIAGALVWLSGRLGWLRLGRLPGDIRVERPGFGLYIPIVTCLLVSLLGSLVLWIVGALRR